MWCDAQFRAFNANLRLDDTRQARIESALKAFAAFCATDPELAAAAAGQPFLQGSVATRTVIRPLASDEFDVDVIYPFRLSAFNQQPTPLQVINWFIGRLKKNGFYESRLIPKDRCARIDYAGDFHVDIIPSAQELNGHQPCAVPAKDLGRWITNNPLGFISWVRQRDQRAPNHDDHGDGCFIRAVRIMKRWRDHAFTIDSAPSSMLLVTFLGNHDPTIPGYYPPLQGPLLPQYQNDAAYLYDLLRLTHSCLENPHQISFQNPSVQGEDLGSHWRDAHLPEFLDRLQACIEHLREGIWAEREGTAIDAYKKAFGGTFPTQ